MKKLLCAVALAASLALAIWGEYNETTATVVRAKNDEVVVRFGNGQEYAFYVDDIDNYECGDDVTVIFNSSMQITGVKLR